MEQPIGFIGLGIMGRPMAANLLAHGFELVVYNRTAERCRPLTDAGAHLAPSPAAVAARCPVIVLMVSDMAAVTALLDGPDGLLEGGLTGRIVVNMSTVAPAESRELARRLAEAGGQLVDAPVSGSKKPAEDGTLVILASGVQEVVDRLAPLFQAMGKKTVYCGEAGQGSAMKMAINLLLGAMVAGLAEAADLARACGLAPETFFQVVNGGALACPLFAMKESPLTRGDFAPQFPLRHMHKDLRLITATARALDRPTPAAHCLEQIFGQAMAGGLGDLDVCGVARLWSTDD